MRSQTKNARKGVTLVELLVVMVIMLVLATIVVAFAPGFQDAQKVSRGADQLQGWLFASRQWARRDRVPTGLRVFVASDPVNGSLIATDIQYVQQPPTFTIPYAVPATTGIGQPSIRKISTMTSAGGSVVSLDVSNPVPLQTGQVAGDFLGGQSLEKGDYLVIHNTICAISMANPPPPTITSAALILASPLAGSIGNCPPTTDYYFVRAPRPVAGEAALKLPQDVVIDLGLSVNCPSSGDHFDILFSPSGELLAPVTSDKVILWIRDKTRIPAPPSGKIENDTLLAVDSRTGLIGSHAVNIPPAGDPDPKKYYYIFTQDGRSSGL